MDDLNKKSEFESFLKTHVTDMQEKKTATYQCYVSNYPELQEYFPHVHKISIIEEIQLCKEIENVYLTFFSIAVPEGDVYGEYKLRSIEVNEKLFTLKKIKGLIEKSQEDNVANIYLMEDILKNKLLELNEEAILF
ncbi:hypothetical protein ACWOFR_03835 [Carnobacterium gallinarum]|uniref:hypothetical protein n=1 Tax=Carnobacterium gallinarum TaxID=2749 RepID=UPI00054D6D60|nr:hypothetical protein [Carnobacterium gallinarum]